MFFTPPKKICIKTSSVHGLGVFATEDILSGELIEVSPISVTKKNQKQPHEWSPQDLMFFKYNGGWGSWISEGLTCVAFGYASLYNHNDAPNTKHEKDINRGAICFYASKDIKAGAECFIYYCDNYQTKFIKEESHGE
jgi:spore coat protein H